MSIYLTNIELDNLLVKNSNTTFLSSAKTNDSRIYEHVVLNTKYNYGIRIALNMGLNLHSKLFKYKGVKLFLYKFIIKLLIKL